MTVDTGLSVRKQKYDLGLIFDTSIATRNPGPTRETLRAPGAVCVTYLLTLIRLHTLSYEAEPGADGGSLARKRRPR